MRNEIRWHLMVRMGVVLVVVLFLNTIINSYFFSQQFHRQIAVQAEAIGRPIVDEVHKALSVLQADEQIFAMFNFNLELLVSERDYLVEAAMFSPAGKFLSHADASNVGRTIPDELARRVSQKGEITKPFKTAKGYTVLLPIKGSQGELAGYLMLTFKKELFSGLIRKLMLWQVSLFVGSVLLMSIIMSVFALQAVSNPLNKLIRQTQVVAGGDLTHEVPAEGAGEIQALADAFNQMLGGLRSILLKINEVSARFTDTCRQLFMLSGEVTQGSRLQMSSLNEASDSVKKMENNVEEIAERVQELNNLSQSTSASILEMTASISEVDNNVEQLAGMVDEISSSILEITQSAREVANSVESLAREAEAAASSVAQMNVSLAEVDANSTLSANLSTQVAEVAEEGMISIERAQEGMRTIRSAVESTAAGIDRLTDRSKKIGKILGVINKIAEETNLLALNAAIIAAEAGEHGKGFNVVANEIQTLAERTTLQTKEIDALIRDVQKETISSVEQTRNVLKRVEEGEKLTTETAQILRKIKDSAKASQDMIQLIAKATQEQTIGVRRVAEASDKVSSEVKQISKATKEQAAGTSRIMDAIERIKDLARAVQGATKEQTEGSKSISKATEQVRDFVGYITKLAEKHRSDAANVSSIVSRNLKIVEENVKRVQEMEVAVEGIIKLTDSLNEELGRFRFS